MLGKVPVPISPCTEEDFAMFYPLKSAHGAAVQRLKDERFLYCPDQEVLAGLSI